MGHGGKRVPGPGKKLGAPSMPAELRRALRVEFAVAMKRITRAGGRQSEMAAAVIAELRRVTTQDGATGNHDDAFEILQGTRLATTTTERI